MEMVLVVVVIEGLDATAPESESSEHFQMLMVKLSGLWTLLIKITSAPLGWGLEPEDRRSFTNCRHTCTPSDLSLLKVDPSSAIYSHAGFRSV